MESNLTHEEIENAKALNGGELLEEFSDDQIRSVYNGCGPEWMPSKVRKILDIRFCLFKLAFVVHDCEFAYKDDRSKKSFNESNSNLYKNCVLLTKEKFSWYNPIRYKALLDALIVYRACKRFAWAAWQENSEPSSTTKQMYEEVGKLDEYYKRHPEDVDK